MTSLGTSSGMRLRRILGRTTCARAARAVTEKGTARMESTVGALMVAVEEAGEEITITRGRALMAEVVVDGEIRVVKRRRVVVEVVAGVAITPAPLASQKEMVEVEAVGEQVEGTLVLEEEEVAGEETRAQQGIMPNLLVAGVFKRRKVVLVVVENGEETRVHLVESQLKHGEKQEMLVQEVVVAGEAKVVQVVAKRVLLVVTPQKHGNLEVMIAQSAVVGVLTKEFLFAV